MKTILILAVAVFTFVRAQAQVTMELELNQNQFLPRETLPVAVKITNLSGQPIHLGADANWLSFSIESVDGFIVRKESDVPVQGEFDLESSQAGTKRVDIAPYFALNKTGRYKITATLHIPAWSATVTSLPKSFDIVHGAKIWTQQFGIFNASNSAPDVRKFMLAQANDPRSQLCLYVQLSDEDESHVLHTEALGQMVSFSAPVAQIDRTSNLHVLWQANAQMFSYRQINSEGKVIRRETYDNFNGRPHLSVNENGEVLVLGGTLHGLPPAAAPTVIAPNELPAAPSKK